VAPDPLPIPESIRFGEDLELDRPAYELRRSGRALKLERIPLDILFLLAERPGQLVTREEIAERIWGKGAHLDVDNSINGAVRKIRQVLKDDSEQPRFIQTVTGRGYRFVAPVAAPAAVPVMPSGPGAAETVAAAAPAPRSYRKAWLAGALALLLLVGALLWSRDRGQATRSDRVMLAVMPFQNLTGDDSQEYFSDGLTEEMITQLGNRYPARLGVIARASVMHFKQTRKPPERIGRELGVQYLLLGSVRRDASTVRVTAQLIRTRDHAQLWAHQYDRELSGLLTLQDEIAREITDAIESSLGGHAPASRVAAMGPPPAPDAYDLYLRGQFFLNKRTDADLRAAAGYFAQATRSDSSFARAWAALAAADVLGAVYSTRPPQDLVARARAAALKALVLNPSLPEAHAALALIVQNHDWDWQGAEREFRRAIDLNPNYATAHHWYAEHLMWRGRFDEALQESEQARRLDPLSLIIAADNGAILYFARRYDRAIDRLRSVRAVDPMMSRTQLLVAVYTEDGKFDQALAEEERWRPIVPAAVHWATLAYVYGRAGKIGEARHSIEELVRASEQDPVQARVFAWSYAGVRDTAQTVAWLEKAYAEHSAEMVSLKVNPGYDFLRGDPRFQRLLDRVGLGETASGLERTTAR